VLQLEVAIELTVPDNTAFTVLVALRQLGYAELARVERADVLRLTLDQPLERADEVVEALKRAEVIFNPNKHRMRRAHSAGGSNAWEAIVSDRDDDNSGLARLLGDHFGVRDLKALERATAWRLFDEHGSAPKERLEWACRELLANAISQRWVTRENERS
jgi:phosphoribosylformylglycinamidine (FGAM) synthase PurS component